MVRTCHAPQCLKMDYMSETLWEASSLLCVKMQYLLVVCCNLIRHESCPVVALIAIGIQLHQTQPDFMQNSAVTVLYYD